LTSPSAQDDLHFHQGDVAGRQDAQHYSYADGY
jgi:hypothetical protein